MSGQILAEQEGGHILTGHFLAGALGVSGVVSPEVVRPSLLFEQAFFDAMPEHVAGRHPSFACHRLGGVER